MSRQSRERDGREEPSAPPRGACGVEFGWRVHGALIEWTKNIDVKASIVLTLILAGTGAVAANVFGEHGWLHNVHGTKLWAERVIWFCIAGAGLAAAWAVIPNLRARAITREAKENRGLVFFGHLRLLDPGEIERGLARLDEGEVLRQLAQQMHVMSCIAWKKHRRLQASILLAAIAALVYAAARIFL